MTEIPYNERRRLLSAAKELMSDIAQHTKSLQTALSFVNAERAESFHADEIVEDTIMLEMILEEFQGNVPEEFEPFEREVEQRRKMYGDLFGGQWYDNKRTALEEELAEASSVPEPTEEEKERMKRAPFIRRPYEQKEKKPKKPSVPLLETGRVIRIYTFEDQQAVMDTPEYTALTSAAKSGLIHPLEARLDKEDILFDELPEHFTIVCLEQNQQIMVDQKLTRQANPYYEKDKDVFYTLQKACELGKNMFWLQQLYEKLMGDEYGE